jgi:hypothetical protein
MARFIPTPKVDLSRPSDAIVRIASVAGITGDTEDLRAQSGKPRHCPQRVTLIGGATALVAVMTTEDAESLTISVPVEGVVIINRPIKTLVKSGSGAVQVVAEYWEPPSSQARNT